MCIGWPMQVVAVQPGHATVQRRGAPATRSTVRTALVGAVQPGDWLLVFLDDAREWLSAERAAEIDATLALVQAALAAGAGALEPTAGAPGSAVPLPFDLPFELPSAQSAASLEAYR